MTEPAKDFWARADRDLLDRWPKDEAGAPEPAAKLDIQWELDSQADITVSFLESCGIPCLPEWVPGQVLGGFASQGVEIWVPASQLEEAQALLNTPRKSRSRTNVPPPFSIYTTGGISRMDFMKEYEKWLASPALSDAGACGAGEHPK